MTSRIASPTKAAVDWGAITQQGLWGNNVILAQGLALCPALAVTSTTTNGLGMGLATTEIYTSLFVGSVRCV